MALAQDVRKTLPLCLSNYPWVKWCTPLRFTWWTFAL